ncbi:MAG: AbrB/MazE/SpoVT family DNA-binding domain-containing protein [candidate division NC10 bacterium]|nr:AbrB/MazE/SpoVT family DNA-binding domain-containing protein [candidate division NC10 bacterium]MBI3003722.1 AbrB/MazE/SpoVT family DNA-binding domain-containing protein [candidate division NC10 bacterium]MBI4391558.1 AbrB/MazE/SpoVT family DNA-binding domain-containing protein [candidate division NC10 bacterium]
MSRVILKGRGQITIPAKIRKVLDLDAGALLQVEVSRGRIVLTPLQVVQRTQEEEGRGPQEGQRG